MEKRHKNALVFIFITLLIDVTGLGIIIPVIPKLITQLTGADLSQASQYGGWLMFSYAIMQFFFSPVLGNLSDRYGRRPVLLFSLLGFGVDYLFLGFAPTLGWLFAGRIIAGITGASFTTAGAYIADVSPPDKRAQNFGIIGAAFGLGFILGPMLGGILGHQFGTRAPFFASAALAFLNLIYGYFILPESLPKENRRAFDWRRANPVGSLLHLGKYPVILGLVASYFFIFLAANANQSTWTYYTMFKFNWNEAWVGYSLGFVGLMIALVQGLLARVVIPKIGERRAVYVGLCLYVVGFGLMSVAANTWQMFLFVVPMTLGGLAGPALQGIVSKQVPPNEQGELQGAMTSVMSVTSIIGPVMMTGLFHYFTAKGAPVQFPGVPFATAALLCALAAVFAVRTLARKKTA
jgi:DHA1 family tetracycline resistance protein-like MFS transporter